MTRAPEAVDKAVDAVRRAEQKLVGGAEVARKEVAARTRRTSRKLARKAKATRKEMARNAKATRKELARGARKARTSAQQLTGRTPRRRRWPWLVGLLVAALGAAAVARSKSGTTAEPVTPEPGEQDRAEAKQNQNGQVKEPVSDQRQ